VLLSDHIHGRGFHSPVVRQDSDRNEKTHDLVALSQEDVCVSLYMHARARARTHARVRVCVCVCVFLIFLWTLV